MEECIIENNLFIGIGATITLLSLLTNCILYNLYSNTVSITPNNSPTNTKKKFYKLGDNNNMNSKLKTINYYDPNSIGNPPKNIKIRRYKTVTKINDTKNCNDIEKGHVIKGGVAYKNNNLPQWVIDDYNKKSNLCNDKIDEITNNTIGENKEGNKALVDIELGIELPPYNIYDATHC